jgi:threonine synthase
LKHQANGNLPKGKRIVVTVTGHGLKDIQWALEAAADPIVVPVDAKAAAEKLGLA